MANTEGEDDALRERVQNLTPELFDMIFEFVLSINESKIEITSQYRPPVQLQIDRASRNRVAEEYYRKTVSGGLRLRQYYSLQSRFFDRQPCSDPAMLRLREDQLANVEVNLSMALDYHWQYYGQFGKINIRIFLITSLFHLKTPNSFSALFVLPHQPPPKLKPFSKTLTLVDLPGEIRNTISGHALIEPEPILMDENTWLDAPSLVRLNEVEFSGGHWREGLKRPAALKAATQIRNEAASIFYKDNIFYAKEASAARNWLSSVRRTVQLEIDRIRLNTEDGIIIPGNVASDVFDEKWLEREKTYLRGAGQLRSWSDVGDYGDDGAVGDAV
ncbi:hypothetical protein Slin15195_G107440 [Septoria linicola]|uniref:Uncharacterized protein n=1 Tax=Septoria linicola TaxID=215465 RepID=A0A9Q9AYF6_9PEZI|nr:hypothetical protein Slin14017_G070390 [Septoria linicola]USW57425.1 hypothetical protein Slin15195_G107440 [Septoria linicola]